jgi:glucokinase
MALASTGSGRPELREVRSYESREHEGLASVVRRYLDELGGPEVDRARFAAACPLAEGRCTFTNLDWVLDEKELSRELGIDDLRLLNDFEALGHAVPLLADDDTVLLRDGDPEPGGPILLVGAGTGLGVAYLTAGDDGAYRVHASEGGHQGFAPRSELDDRLLAFLRRRHGGRVSWERVVSGPGIESTYDFVVADGRVAPHPGTRAAMEAGDPAAVVAERARSGTDAAAEQAMEIFLSAFGAQAGNLALAFKSTGGVVVAGGIAPRNLEAMKDGTFEAAFLDKGRLSHVVEDMPIRIVTATTAGIVGAAAS